MNNQKNNTLELLKLFSSYMVVFIHVPFYGRLGIVMDTLARFAVPLFFLISGFYSYQITPEKIKKRIRNIFTLLILSTVCYTAFKILLLLSNGSMGEIASYFSKYVDFFTLSKLFLLNMPFSSVHLWYLLAMLYVYVIFYFVTMFRINDKAIFIVSLSLLFLHMLLGEGLSILGIVLPVPIVRNFAVTGIPFFCIRLACEKKYEYKFQTIPNYIYYTSIILGIIESTLSRYIWGKNELYLGSLFILFAIVCVFIKYSSVHYPSFLTKMEGCSTYIYIFHIMISAVINKFYTVFGIHRSSSVILKNLHPIVVCVSSTIFAYFLIKILKKGENPKTASQLHKEQAR